MTHQLSIEDAISAGQIAMQACADKAERDFPQFREKAREAILAHLRVVGQCSGEELTDIAKAHGAVPPDARAFGAVFQGLARGGFIVCLRSDLPRRRGHGTSGGRLWELVR
jgi:hypothetical protein